MPPSDLYALQFDYTPLHRAAMKGQVECAKLLIERGCDVNAKNSVSCLCPTLPCPTLPYTSLFKFAILIFLISQNGKTPLDVATINAVKEVIRKAGGINSVWKELIDITVIITAIEVGIRHDTVDK